MRTAYVVAAALVLVLPNLGLAQGHSGHGGHSPIVPDSPSKAPVVTRRFGDAVAATKREMEKLKEAAAASDEASFGFAVDSYLAALADMREAMRNPPQDKKQFEKDLAAGENELRQHMESIRSLIESSPATRKEKLEKAGLTAGQTLDATTIMRDEINPKRRSAPRESPDAGGAE